MSLRILILGLVWFGAMLLLFFTPSESQPIYFDWLPSRSIVHGFLFWGFVHIWLGACKKQYKYSYIRNNAFLIVFIAALAIGLICEVIVYLVHLSPSISIWNLAFDLIGSFMGLMSFRILYATCY